MLTAADLAQIQAMIDTAPAVGEGFANPVVAGTQLVIPAINSPNFVHGSAGWTLNRDGSAEFSNVIIRNGQIISGTDLIYSSSPPVLGNLVASFSAAAGTDTPGNAYLAGITTYAQAGGVFYAVNLSISATGGGSRLSFLIATSAAGPYAEALAFINGLTVAPSNIAAVLTGIRNIALVAPRTINTDLPAQMTLNTVPAGGNPTLSMDNGTALALAALANAVGAPLTPLLYQAGGHAQAVSSTDGNAYDVERLTLVTSGGTVSLVAFTTIGGLTKQVKAGSYHFRAHLMYVGNGTGATASPLFRVRSPAFSSGSLQLVGTANGPLVSVRFDNASGFGSNLSAPALTAGDSTTRYDVVIEGQAIFTATGGLDVQASIGVAGNAQFVIAAGSTFEIEPIVAT